MKNRLLAAFFVLALYSTAFAQGECEVYTGDRIDFNNTTVHGTLITNPQGQVIINNYIQPTENIDQINRQLAELHKLQQQIDAGRLSNEKQLELIRQKEEEMKTQQADIDREKQSVLWEKEKVLEVKNNFNTDFQRAKSEFQTLQSQMPTPSANISSPTTPIESIIQEKIVQAEQIIKSTEMCIAQDFEIIPIKDTQTGKITYGFSLEEIRKDPNYILIDDYSEGMARVKRSNKFGYYNQKGELAVDFKYDYAESFRDGLAVVRNIQKWFLIRPDGSTALSFNDDIKSVSSIPSAPQTYLCKGKQGVYLADIKGKRLSDYYQDIAPFDRNGFAMASNPQKGLINVKGEVAIPCLYDEVGAVRDARYVRVKLKKDYGIYDMHSKKEVLGCLYLQIPDAVTNLGVVTDSLQRKGLINQEYQLLTPCKYKIIKPFDENGRAMVQDMGGLWGYIDQSGKEIISCSLNEVPVFTDGIAIIQSEEGFGVMNKEIQIVIPAIHQQILHSGKVDLMIVQDKRTNKYGLTNTQGQIIAKPQYDKIAAFDRTGLAVITVGTKQGLMDAQGQIIAKPQHDKIAPFDRTGLAVITVEAKQGLMDTLGLIVLEPVYEEIKNYEGTNYKLIRLAQQYGLFDGAQKKEVIKAMYKEIKEMKYGLIVCEKESYKSDWFFYDSSAYLKPVTTIQNVFPYSIRQFNLQNDISPDIKLYKWGGFNDYLLFNPKSLRLVVIGTSTPPILNRHGQIVYVPKHELSFLLLDADLRPVGTTRCSSIEPGDNGTYMVSRGSYANIGYINTTGELIIDYLYNSGSQPFEAGSAIVAKGKNYGVVNLNGLEFIPIIFEKIERTANGFKVYKGENIFDVTTEGKCISENKEIYVELVKKYHQQR